MPKTQAQQTTSLLELFKNANHDTTRCNILSELIDSENDDKVWPTYNDQLLQLAQKGVNSSSNNGQKIFYSKHLASALNNIGFLAQNQGDIPKALTYYLKSLTIEEEIKNKKGIAYSLNNIGSIYKDQGDISKGLEYYHRSLKIREEIGDKKGVANALNNIGIIHKNQGDFKKGLEYHFRSLKMREQTHDNHGIAASLNNIGAIYNEHGDPACQASKEKCYRDAQAKALEYYNRSLKIREGINDKLGIGQSYSNIGGVYSNLAEEEKRLGNRSKQEDFLNLALDYYQKSLKIQEEIKDKSGIANSLINISTVLLHQHKGGEALKLAEKSLQISKELGFPKNMMRAAAALKRIYKKQNKAKEAFDMYSLEIQMRDSINNQETKKASVKKQFQYEYEKQAAADSVKHVEEQKVRNSQLAAQQAQLKQERTQRFALYGSLGLVIVFSIFVYKRFKVTQRQKKIIENQKLLVDQAFKQLEEKNKEVLDSIHYAKKIQTALLTNEKYINRKLNELLK
ncbi:MAG: tetratricopeptide repeat protein [Bacteroidota bacterium]